MEDTQSQQSSMSMSTTRTTQIKKLVNKIFEANNCPVRITNMANDFADGSNFVLLFNFLFDEKMDLKLSKEN